MSQTFKIDPAHSSAQFVVKHMMITNVRGAFSSLQGSVDWDATDPGQSKVEVRIDAKTIQTHEPDRDKHLRSADFLDVEKFPVINFKSTSVKPAGEGELNITGDLNIHGVTKPVVLKVNGPTAETKDPWGNVRIGASGTTKIKRSDFGLTWNAALETGGFLVGDEVKIELEISLIKA